MWWSCWVRTSTRWSMSIWSKTEEDESELLIETVSGEFIRPVPPRIRFGRVTGKKGMMYHVYFDYTGDEIAYPVSKLRVHLDWSNGRWVSPDRRKKRVRDSSRSEPARSAPTRPASMSMEKEKKMRRISDMGILM
ncbi:unnamed protein product [Linum tenue]|uniref:Uncharacterized protein n=1 Tax=Linum tenue TaxID=586396 RepID=A0AAV0MYC8_9ROSI|nr:unnamed protein product [Linum tenue]